MEAFASIQRLIGGDHMEPFLVPRGGLGTEVAAPDQTVGPGILYGAAPGSVQ